MMNHINPSFVIVVSASPFAGTYHRSAQDFCRAVLAENYEISQVFFYGDGCLVANRALGSDENHQGWIHLAKEHHIPLNLCITSAQNRGVLDEENAEYLNRSPANTAPEFTLMGLAQFFESDRQLPTMHFKGTL